MGNVEYFIKRVYELTSESKIPLIDEKIHDKVKLKSNGTVVKFRFEQDESIIRGFLGLSEYFHSVVIKKKDEFIISTNNIIFLLHCA